MAVSVIRPHLPLHRNHPPHRRRRPPLLRHQPHLPPPPPRPRPLHRPLPSQPRLPRRHHRCRRRAESTGWPTCRCSTSSPPLCRNTAPTHELSVFYRRMRLQPRHSALTESTVRTWYEPHSFTLKPSVEARIRGATIKGRTGRPPVMGQRSDVEAYVFDTINCLRAAGSPINSVVIASRFRGYVKAKHPDLLKSYKFSRRWCRHWFGQTSAWTWKKTTTSGQKLPTDWEKQVANMVKRVAAKAAQFKITHPCFIINWDQTGLVLMPAPKYTYHHVKEKQVPVIGQEEKRQITAVVASSLSGDLLLLQLIFKGQDTNRKQQKAVPTLGEVDTRRTREWHLTQTYNHWSTLQSMKDYIRLIIHPYVQSKAREHKLAAPHCVLLLDCWSVHTSAEFRTWMEKAYPNYHLVFIPAGCTGKAQPADVALQRPFKTGITNAFTSWMTCEINLLVKGGLAPHEVRVNTGMGTLKPLIVSWAWESWYRLREKKEVVLSGWARCGMGDVLQQTDEQKMAAMSLCLSEPNQVLGEEPEVEVDEGSDGEEVGMEVEVEADAEGCQREEGPPSPIISTSIASRD